MIEVKHLTKHYGDKVAVNDISFTVQIADPGKGTDRLSAGAAAPLPGYDCHGISEFCL